jgi:hypothetical protein
LPGLEDLLDDLAAQTLIPKRLIVAVESAADPAYRRALATRATERRFAVDVVIAGLADDRGQKSTNILAAAAMLTNEDDYVLFIDADIRPQPWYVAGLVAPLTHGHADLVNGYRWLTPVDGGLAAAIVAAIDRRVSVLPRFGFRNLVWGGSMAFSAKAVRALDLPATLAYDISDDLAIERRAAEIGLRVLVRPALRTPTPLDGDARRVFSFARRQLQYLWLYRPALWCFGTAVTVCDLIARLFLLVRLASVAGDALPLACVVAAIVAMDALSVTFRLLASARIGVSDARAFQIVQYGLAATIVPLPLAWASLFCLSFRPSSIKWAHVRYEVEKGGRVRRVWRDSHA